MATVTHRALISSTSNNQNFNFPSFTPTAGDVVLVAFSPSVVVATSGAAVTASANGLTFYEVTAARTQRASVDDLRLFVSTTVPASPVAMTVTTNAGLAGNGEIAFMCTVSGLTRSALSAVRQAVGSPTAGTNPPTATLPGNASSANPLLSFAFNATSPSGLTIPTSWTLGTTDTGYSTPTRGGIYAYRNSGQTNPVVTWGTASGSASGVIVVELDVTTPAALATGSLDLSGTATAEDGTPTDTPASAAGSLDLTGTADGSVPGGASGSLSLSGTAGVSGAVGATGSLALSGTAGSASALGASGSITLSGSATVLLSAGAEGMLSLSGSAGGQTPAGAAGSITLSGSAVPPPTPAGAEGFFAILGTADLLSDSTATGSLELSGYSSGTARVQATGGLSLTGTAGTRTSLQANGSLTLSGQAGPLPLVEAYGSIEFTSGDVDYSVGLQAEGFIEFSGTALLVRPPDLRRSRATLRPQTTRGVISPNAHGTIRPPTTRGRIRS